MPLDEPPVTDSGADLTHQSDPLSSQSLDDLRLQPNLPLVGVSANRNSDPEDVVIDVAGRERLLHDSDHGLQRRDEPEPVHGAGRTAVPHRVSNVPARNITGTAGPALPNTLPTGLNTVFLVNRRQIRGRCTTRRARRT